jgi:hypothetical protein
MKNFSIEREALYYGRIRRNYGWTSRGPDGGAGGIADDPDSGAIYITCSHKDKIRQIVNGRDSVLAGPSGIPGTARRIRKESFFSNPTGLIFDRDEKVLFVADTDNSAIKQVKLDGTVTTIISNPPHGRGDYYRILHRPMYLAFTKDKDLLITDSGNHQVKIFYRETKRLKTLAGSVKGFQNGEGSSAKFNRPVGITVAKDGSIFVCDSKNHSIRKIDQDGEVSTLYQYGSNMDHTFLIGMPWNLVIVDDLFIVTTQRLTTLIIFRIEKNYIIIDDRPRLHESNNKIIAECKGLSLSLDGTILGAIPEKAMIVRFKVSTPYSLSKDSEEEHLA